MLMRKYIIMQQEKGTLQKIEWLRIVLDEAHIIRNRRTLQAQAAIAVKAQCKWALTGTSNKR